jgi:peptidyl-tRNA hydrolase
MKLVLLVRTNLGMGVGKTALQISHASVLTAARRPWHRRGSAVGPTEWTGVR